MGLVIDTNVLEHADNPQELRYESSIAFLNHIRAATGEVIYVDESLSPNESFILNEYRNRLVPGNFGTTVLLLLTQQGRVTPIKRAVPATITKKIKKWAHKPVDVIFLKVAYNSNEKILVSHDFEDFPQKARDFFLDEINVDVVTAATFLNS